MAGQSIPTTAFMATKFNAPAVPATAPAPPHQGNYPHKFGSPLQAPIRSAWLGGTLEGPPVKTDTSQVRKSINGMAQLAAACTLQWNDFVFNGQPWVTQGIARINPFPSIIAAFQGAWDLYSSVADTYTDNSGGGGSFTNTSGISGGGDCPIVSLPPSWWYPWRDATGIPGPWSVNGFADGSQMADPNGFWTFSRVQTGPLDIAGQFTDAASVLDTLAFNSSVVFDQPSAIANHDITGLVPAMFTGNPLPSGASASFPNVGSAFSGWSLTGPSGGGGQIAFFQKQRATLPIGNSRQPFFVARYQEGLQNGIFGIPKLPTDVRFRISFIENGFLNPGESIGTGGSTIDLPQVSSATTGGTLGTAPMITDGYFAVIGKTPQQWSKDLRLNFGDNF